MTKGRSGRTDLDDGEIALAWISGMSHARLAIEFDCDVSTIQIRLRKARKEHPDLPWGTRPTRHQAQRDENAGVARYVKMNDGKPGTKAPQGGSVIRSSALRRRGR